MCRKGMNVPRYRNEILFSPNSASRFREAIPIDIYRELIRRFSGPGDWILNPYLGTGNCTQAAILAGRNSVGVEIDRKRYNIARTNLGQYRSKLELRFGTLKQVRTVGPDHGTGREKHR